jgi:predicted O-methyltransferase YrrM
MIEIKDYQENKRFQHHFDVIRANAPVSYGGLKLYEGKRNYLMQSPKEFAATLCYLEEYFVNKKVNYLEIGTASNLTNSMIWNSLNIKENIILDNLECPYTAESLVGNLSFKQNTVLIVGDSTQEEIKDKVNNLGYKYNLMLIDGNHDYEYVTKDFEYYYRFLSDDGLLIFHDIDNDAVPGVRKFVKNNTILNTYFTQCANFVDNSNYLNKNTFGSQCGIGIYKKI